MDEKQLIETCKEIIDKLSWDEFDLFGDGEFESYLNEKLNTDRFYYSVSIDNTTDWEDDGIGKYYSQYITYQLVQCDKEIEEWATEESITKRFNIYFDLSVTKTGSYYTDYYYSYEKPTMMQKKIIHVPEQIIPAHDEERMEII